MRGDWKISICIIHYISLIKKMNTQPPFPQKPNTPPPLYSSIRLLFKLDHTSRLIANVYPTIPAKKRAKVNAGADA